MRFHINVHEVPACGLGTWIDHFPFSITAMVNCTLHAINIFRISSAQLQLKHYHPPQPTSCCPLSFPIAGSLSRGGEVVVYNVDINQPSLRTPFLFRSFVYFCLYGSFICISFHKFSRQLSAFSLRSFCFISAFLILSTSLMKVSLSTDIILCG